VLLLDEPSTGLDPAAKLALWQYLETLQRVDGVTIVLATHMMDEADRCGTAAILNAGRVITVGPPERLKSEVGGNVVAVEASGAETLAPAIRERFGVEVRVTSDTLKIEKSDAENFAARLIEAFPGRIRSVRIGRPTLEDVFLHHTGRAFDAHDLHAGASR
jgi:ABC-2 type transport system ATP-binding protein